MKNKHTLIIALVLFATSLLQPAIAQDGLNVPFSQYGIGLTDMPYNMPRAFGMGGTVYSRSSRNTVNPFNPASYAAVESESFVFDIGINIQNSVLRGGNSRLPGAEGSLAYLAVPSALSTTSLSIPSTTPSPTVMSKPSTMATAVSLSSTGATPST